MIKKQILGAVIGATTALAVPLVASNAAGSSLVAYAAETVGMFTVDTYDDGTAAIKTFTNTTETSVQIPSEIEVGGENYTVTKIADGAFRNKAKLEKVIIPETVTSIGANAFYGCSKLSSVNLPAELTELGANAFYNCKLLQNITIPDTLTVIKNGTFFGCGFKEITIPKSIRTIEANAFANCASLVTVNVPDYTEEGNYININGTAFKNCANLDFAYFQFDIITENNNASIKGIIGRSTSLVLPDTIDGYKVVTISKGAFKNNKDLQSVIIPEGIRTMGEEVFSGCTTLTHVELPTTLSRISKNAFANCTALQVAPFSNEIVAIDEGAFSKCTRLTDVQFPDSLNIIGKEAFLGCTQLETINMPNSVTSIGENSFKDCTNLSSLRLSESITTIPKGAFTSCVSLETVVIPRSVTEISDGTDKLGAFQFSGVKDLTLSTNLHTIGSYAFADCTSLPKVTMADSVIKLGTGVFRNCSALTEVRLSEKLTEIPTAAFTSCTSLPKIVIPESVKVISDGQITAGKTGTGAFEGCSSLSEVTLPKRLEKIGNAAFKKCYSIKDIKLPSAALTYVGNESFAYCSGIEQIDLPNSIKTIGFGAFRSTSLKNIILPTNSEFKTLNYAVFADCVYLSKVTIPDFVTTISDARANGTDPVSEGTFYNCVSLEEINLPSKLTSVGSAAFACCTNLKSISIPNTVTKIGSYTFYDCRAMEKAEIGKAVTSIGTYAFEHCKSLTEINIPSKVTTIGQGAFSACENLKKMTTNANIVSTGKADASFYEVLFYSDSKICLQTFYGDDQYTVNHALEEIVFDRGVTEIGDNSFSGAAALQRITIANSVRLIGKNAFFNCKKLYFVNTIPKSVAKIDDYAFSGCPNLKAMIIPSTVTSMGYKVFAGCVDLTIFGEAGSAADSYVTNDNEDISFVDIYAKITNPQLKLTDDGVQLSWDKIDTNIKGYKIDKIVYHIYRTDLTAATPAETVIADTENNFYLDKEVTDRHKYTYFIDCTYCFTAKDEEYTVDTSRVAIGEVSVTPSTKPRNVKAEAGDGCATITWDRVEGATQYRIYQVTSRKFINIADTDKTSYTVTGLTNGSAYTYLVLAAVNGEWNSYTSDDYVTVTPAAEVIETPFVTAEAGDSTATLTWDALEGASQYRVYQVTSRKYITIADTTETTYTVTGLTNGTTYRYLVLACINGKWSTYTDDDIVSVTPQPSATVKPVVSAEAIAGGANVTWTPVNGAVKYRVYYFTAGQKIRQFGSDTTDLSMKVMGLRSDTETGIIVLAQYANGKWTSYTEDDIAYVTADDAVKPFLCVNPKENGEVYLIWSSVPTSVRYKVMVRVKGGNWDLAAATRQRCRVTLKSLDPNTEYEFLVRGLDQNGKYTPMGLEDIIPGSPLS